jgi:CubicO group peptidase (beta-lactamase class C family)
MRDRSPQPAFDAAARSVETGDVPFLVVGVAGAEQAGRIEAFSPAHAPRIGANAVCLLASITKPIFGTLVMRLVQTGRFALTAPLARWLPELDAAGLSPFTAWHVLTHTTGIADIELADLLLGGGDRPELLRRTIDAGQGWTPGSRFQYATFTFDLLADAIERALDRPWEELLREEILDPLGMIDTTFDHRAAGDRRAPVVVGSWNDALQPIPPGVAAEDVVAAYSSLHLAGGGLWSTARDLVRFGRAMLRGGELDGIRILGRPLLELMTREVTVGGLGDTGDRLTHEHYAIGWGKPGAASPASPLAFLHGGVSGTRLLVDPGNDLVLVALSGKWGGAAETLDRVVMAAYGSIDSRPDQLGPNTADPRWPDGARAGW